MEKLKSIAVLLVAGYTFTAMLIFAPYYNWTYARDNGFIKWLLLGEIFATAKAVAWPYFAFFDKAESKEALSEVKTASLAVAVSSEQKISEYTDNEYNYAFQFPADWKMVKAPEANEVAEARVILQGPKGMTASVTVSKIGTSVTKQQFENNPKRNEIVEGMINLTIEQVYKKTSRDVNATRMVVAEKKIMPSDSGIKFYISTLQFLGKKEIPMALVGIHVLPFGKDYLINFAMTSLVDKGAKQENETFTHVFNSFHLVGEKPTP